MANLNLSHSYILVLVLNIGSVYNQNVPTCPDIFTRDGSRISGQIELRGAKPVARLALEASFSGAGNLPNSARIELENPKYALQNYNRGLPIQYRVYFPDTSQIIVTNITVNGRTICNGAKLFPGPNQFVTNLNLKHTSILLRTEDQFSAVRPQLNQDEPYSGLFVDFPDTSTPERDDVLLDSFQTNPSVQEIPVTRPSQKVVPEVADIPYVVREETTEPPQPVATRSFSIVNMYRPTQRQPEPESDIECGTRSSNNDRLALIYNGKNYMRGDLPWLVAIYMKKESSFSFICGGTLVSNRHVITAAHCMLGNERSAINDLIVKVGIHNLDDWDDDITVTRTLIDVKIHESFNASSLENDILVLTFTKRVKFNAFIRPACLWNSDPSLDRIVGSSGTVAGWGVQTNKGGINEPQLANVPVVKTETCRLSNIVFYKVTSDESFCAGDRNGTGPCTGDSGGGFYLLDEGKWRLRGIVSFALRGLDGSCDLTNYVVFSDTARYLNWIREALARDYLD